MLHHGSSFSEKELLQEIDKLNKDDNVDGILVQLPLPDHIDEQKVLNAIDPSKDVDGFHPNNIANLFLGEESLVPCTPKGMLVLLDEIGYDLEGKEVVIVGRSNIVGKDVYKRQNLANAKMKLIKYGANPSYHIRNKIIEKITTNSLPVGIVSKLKMSSYEMALKSDDIIIMSSDGKGDNFENIINDNLDLIDQLHPQEVATLLMDKVLEDNNLDDISIIAVSYTHLTVIAFS